MNKVNYAFSKYKTLFLFLFVAIIIVALCTSFVLKMSDAETETDQTSETIETTESQPLSPEEVKLAIKEAIVPIEYIKEILEKIETKMTNGRFPGTEGNTLAADIIREEMTKIGLSSPLFAIDFMMPFEMNVPTKQSVTTMALTDGEFQYDFSFGEQFVEYVGRDFAKGIGSYEGTFAIIDDPFEVHDFESLGFPEIVVYTEKAIAANPYETLFSGILAAEKPPKVVLYENSKQNSGHFVISPYSRMVTSNDNENGLLIYKVSPEAVTILKERSEGILTVNTDVKMQTVEVNNVVGMIDGTGDSGIIISAHFDHLGANLDGSYNPGALDNASGVTAMLALADAVKRTADPELDYYFIAFNGEEEGLYGSEAFAMSNSLESDKFKVFNVDMVGSSLDIPVEISSTATQSKTLQDEMIAYSENYGIEVLPSAKGSSDHVPLEAVGFRVVSLTEFDERFYHTPGDTINNSIDFVELQNIAVFIYNFVFGL